MEEEEDEEKISFAIGIFNGFEYGNSMWWKSEQFYLQIKMPMRKWT